LQHKAHQLEHQMYPLVLQWLSLQRLQLTDNLPVFNHETLHSPLLFNESTDAP